MTIPTLRRFCRLQRGVGFPPDQQGETNGELPFFKVGDFASIQNQRFLNHSNNWVSGDSARQLGAVSVPPGSVLLPKIGAALLANARRVTTVPSVFDNNVLAVIPERIESRYLYYLLSTIDLAEIANPGPVPSLDDSALLDQRVLCSSASTQRAIADYLDTETARIDALIEKKRRMVELLEERNGASIRSAVNALSDAWVPLKRRWSVIDCKHRTPNYLDEGIPVVSPGDATPGRLDLARAHRFVAEVDYADLAEPPRRPAKGDIIYSRNASIGIASYVDTDERFCMGQDVCLITSRDQDQLYLMYLLNSVGRDLLDEAKIGSTFSRVNIEQIVEMRLPIPAVAAQRSLGQQFDSMSRQTQRLSEDLARQIELLVERRQAMITAAVTGELDIPGVAA